LAYFTVWVSRSGDLEELLEIDNDLLRYDHLTRENVIELFDLSFRQGYTCVIVSEETEAEECRDENPHKTV